MLDADHASFSVCYRYTQTLSLGRYLFSDCITFQGLEKAAAPDSTAPGLPRVRCTDRLSVSRGRRHGFLNEGGRVVGRVANLSQNTLKIGKNTGFWPLHSRIWGVDLPGFQNHPDPPPPPVGDTPAVSPPVWRVASHPDGWLEAGHCRPGNGHHHTGSGHPRTGSDRFRRSFQISFGYSQRSGKMNVVDLDIVSEEKDPTR